MHDSITALGRFVGILERQGVRYAVGGSLASSMHGEPRTTHDADVLVRIDERALEELVESLGSEFHVPVDSAREAVRAQSSFSILHLESVSAIDVFVAGDRPLDREQLERRTTAVLPEGEFTVAVTSPEIMILRKLDWFRKGGEVSERQWRDVQGILKTQGDGLDFALMHTLADQLGLSQLLYRALTQGQPSR